MGSLTLFQSMKGILLPTAAKGWIWPEEMSHLIFRVSWGKVESTWPLVLNLSLFGRSKKNIAPSVWVLSKRHEKRKINTLFQTDRSSSLATTKKKQEKSCFLLTKSVSRAHVNHIKLSRHSVAAEQSCQSGHRPSYDPLQLNRSERRQHLTRRVPWQVCEGAQENAP